MKFSTILYAVTATIATAAPQDGPKGSVTVESSADFAHGASLMIKPPQDSQQVSIANASYLKIYYGHFKLTGHQLLYLFGGRDDQAVNVDVGPTKVDDNLPVIATNPKGEESSGFQIKAGYLIGAHDATKEFYACQSESDGVVVAYLDTNSNPSNCVSASLKWNSFE